MTPSTAPAPAVPATVSDALAQLNQTYGWRLPLAQDFPAGSQLQRMWLLPVAVLPDPAPPLLFEARATRPFLFFDNAVPAELVVSVSAGTDAPPAPRVSFT
jgi:hypothetical protein